MGSFDTRFYVEMKYPSISDKDGRFQDFIANMNKEDLEKSTSSDVLKYSFKLQK